MIVNVISCPHPFILSSLHAIQPLLNISGAVTRPLHVLPQTKCRINYRNRSNVFPPWPCPHGSISQSTQTLSSSYFLIMVDSLFPPHLSTVSFFSSFLLQRMIGKDKTRYLSTYLAIQETHVLIGVHSVIGPTSFRLLRVIHAIS